MSAVIETPDITTVAELAQIYAESVRKDMPDAHLFNLACGKREVEGFKGVDFYADTDIRHDLINGSWDFVQDNSVGMFYCSHFFEHVADQNAFMMKAWRKLRTDGLFLIITPYGWSPRAWQDPDHKRPIFRETYAYFNKKWRAANELEHYEGAMDFDIVDMWPVWSKKYAARAEAAVKNNPEIAETFLTTIGAVDDLIVLLKKRASD